MPRFSSDTDVQARRQALARIDALANALDSAFRIPGTRIRVGADALLNVLPGVGPLVAKALAGYLILEARRSGASDALVARMVGNVALDLLIGAVPLIGWTADIFFRANERNLALLRAHLAETQTAGERPALLAGAVS